jgi:hypothetical protein
MLVQTVDLGRYISHRKWIREVQMEKPLGNTDAAAQIDVAADRSPWMTTVAAARYLSSTPGTLKTWRASGTGPKHHGSHRFVRYHIGDLDRFVRGGSEGDE